MLGATYTDGQQGQVSRLFPDLLRSRQLLLDLISKDLRARYRYALMGFLWAILEPLALTLVLYFVFGIVFQLRTGSTTPSGYAASLLCGLIFWQFLARAVSAGTRSLVDHANLVSKVYFTRETVPLAAVGVSLFNFAIGFVILLVLVVALVGFPGLNVVWLLPVFTIELALVVGLVLLLSSLNVFYRDVAYVVEVGLMLGFYATPIFYDYTTQVLPQQAEHPWLVRFYPLNPMVGLITAVREALLHDRMPDLASLAWPALCSAAVLALGAIVFRRKAGVFADFL